LTLAVKNLFGLMPGLRKGQWHFRAAHERGLFARMLVEIYRHVRPGLTIVDGVHAMEGQGPMSGAPRSLGFVLASDDALAADAVLTRLLGVPPERHPVLREARALGLPEAELEHVELLGAPLESLAVRDFRLPDPGGVEVTARGVWRFLREPFLTRPVVVLERCTACAACHRICPAGAITMLGGPKDAPPGERPRAVIDREKCIQCFCCDEVCPEQAIRLKKGWLARLLIR
jgi:ferredoxin